MIFYILWYYCIGVSVSSRTELCDDAVEVMSLAALDVVDKKSDYLTSLPGGRKNVDV